MFHTPLFFLHITNYEGFFFNGKHYKVFQQPKSSATEIQKVKNHYRSWHQFLLNLPHVSTGALKSFIIFFLFFEFLFSLICCLFNMHLFYSIFPTGNNIVQVILS